MTIPAPRLDDRTFQDLVDEAKRFVMRRCPSWTDHNLSDPGVTLIETFAYLTEQLIYRLNKVPDRLQLAFLDLIGLTLIPPTPARTEVTMWLSTPPPSTFVVPAGTQVRAQPSGGGGDDETDLVVFATVADLELPPCAVVAVATARAVDDGAQDRTDAWQLGAPLSMFADPPVPGDALLVGLDQAVPHAAVRIDFRGEVDGVGVNPASPPLVWEASDGSGWLPCDTQSDDTGGFNRTGSLVVHVPAGHAGSVVAGRAGAWLRARVVEPEDGQPGYRHSPVVRALAACTVGGTVAAQHAQVVESEDLGQAEGVAGQRFTLAHRPVLASVADPVVEVSSPDGWLAYTLVEHFGDSSSHDRHVQLDRAVGEVRFGPAVREQDGSLTQRGAIPAAGSAVRIRGYAIGGGSRGNVAAGTLTALRTTVPFVTRVENRSAAVGGSDGESLDEARARGPVLLRTRDRAVTAEDYEALAHQVAPELARVRCVPADGTRVPAGSVKVLLVPAAPCIAGRVELEDLVPRPETVRQVVRRLEEVRVAGVRVEVEPPRYRGVTVVARLAIRPGRDANVVQGQALDALYELLNPLPGHGPDGQGWRFGHPVVAGQVLAALHAVPGVDLVEELRLFGADPVTGRRGAEVSRLEMDDNALAFSFEHQVRVEGP